MPSGVIHQPRVAWDAALLGPEFAAELNLTRVRLGEDPFTANVEAGKWRVRLEDVLRARPDLAEPLHRLAAEARSRLP